MQIHCYKLEADDGNSGMLIFGAADLGGVFDQQPSSRPLPGERLQEITLATDAAGHVAVSSQVELVDSKN